MWPNPNFLLMNVSRALLGFKLPIKCQILHPPISLLKYEWPSIISFVKAVNENETLKRGIFEQLGSLLTKADAIVASNTSSISITKLAASYRNPSRFIGMHFMNPGELGK